MAEGGGKYGEICDEVLERLNAGAVLMAVADGEHGTGFTLSTTDAGYLFSLPEVLEEMAEKIREDIKIMKERRKSTDGG